MTIVEEKIYRDLHKKHVLSNIIYKLKAKIYEYIEIRREDSYYADSWEQSAQISKDIEKCNEKIRFLEMLERKIQLNEKRCFSETTYLKKLYMHPLW